MESGIKHFDIDFILNKIEGGRFPKPIFKHNEYMWNKADRLAYVESLIMGLPVHFIIVAESSDGSWELVDGRQRMQSILALVGWGDHMGELSEMSRGCQDREWETGDAARKRHIIQLKEREIPILVLGEE